MTPEQFAKILNELPRKFRAALREAEDNAAASSIPIVAKAAPVAFGHLSESTHSRHLGEHAQLVVDAPHAAAVEWGSRPHFVPLEPLVEWVKLRGLQGLNKRRRLTGSTSRMHADNIAAQLRSMVQRRGSTSGGSYNLIDDPETIARAIQQEILKHGTKPHWFVKSELPKMQKILAWEIAKSVRKIK